MTEQELLDYILTRKFDLPDRIRIYKIYYNKKLSVADKFNKISKFRFIDVDLTRKKLLNASA